MTELLVSVRDVAEARIALAAEAAIIDVKEPEHGSLGAASASCWQQVLQAVNDQAPVSVALGELADTDLLQRIGQLPPVTFAKFGLAGAASLADWPARWQAARDALPASTQPVAVIYADWPAAAAPPPLSVLEVAVRGGARMLLCDTWSKQTGWLLQHLPPHQLRLLVDRARNAGLGIVLAGSVTLPRVVELRGFDADYLAVRGAACRGPRTSRIDPVRVGQLVAAAREGGRRKAEG